MTVEENGRSNDSEQQFWELVEKIRERNTHIDPDEIYEDVTRVTEAVRQ